MPFPSRFFVCCRRLCPPENAFEKQDYAKNICKKVAYKFGGLAINRYLCTRNRQFGTREFASVVAVFSSRSEEK